MGSIEEDFLGISPNEMHKIIYEPFNHNLINWKFAEDIFACIPIISQISVLIEHISEKGLKLTNAGFLPVNVVKDIYSKKIILDDSIESGITKLSKEFDSESIHTSRIIATLSGYIRKTNNMLFVTKKGKSLKKDTNVLRTIFNTFGNKFNLGYYDGFDRPHISQIGYQFSLFLLHLFGDKFQSPTFYAEKYFKAFPSLRTDNEDYDFRCYSIRTFERFFKYFGILEFEGNRWDYKVKSSQILNTYFSFNI